MVAKIDLHKFFKVLLSPSEKAGCALSVTTCTNGAFQACVANNLYVVFTTVVNTLWERQGIPYFAEYNYKMVFFLSKMIFLVICPVSLKWCKISPAKLAKNCSKENPQNVLIYLTSGKCRFVLGTGIPPLFHESSQIWLNIVKFQNVQIFPMASGKAISVIKTVIPPDFVVEYYLICCRPKLHIFQIVLGGKTS